MEPARIPLCEPRTRERGPPPARTSGGAGRTRRTFAGTLGFRSSRARTSRSAKSRPRNILGRSATFRRSRDDDDDDDDDDDGNGRKRGIDEITETKRQSIVASGAIIN